MASIDHPTTRRENRSSTTARYSHPTARQMEVVSATHLVLGSSATLVALEQIGSHLCPWLILRGNRAMTWTLCEEPLFSHETSHPLTRTMNALCMEFRMNTWTAIHAAIGLESCLHFRGRVGHLPGCADSSGASAKCSIHSPTRRAPYRAGSTSYCRRCSSMN